MRSFKRLERIGKKDRNYRTKRLERIKRVTSMEGMLKGQSRLERVSITEANMPNLTSTANMFSGCTNLTEVDLSGWTGMESPAITGMFTNAPVNINLTADNDAIGTAIKEEYEKANTSP
ncbi:MAG: BspA family leucine-rich repeat surface protein [Eubacteriales bacterium]